ncbi:MAG: hypothetical protein P1V97_04670 [Planctomycetota bacterium]|nr:hypothetical protein [Planctomycetota bacterium]
MKPRRSPWTRWILALLLMTQLTGCFAPSYMTPEKPYSKSEGTVMGKTYYYCYDTTVGLQVIPLPLIYIFGWEEGSQGRDITLSCAMPVAFIGMIVFGSIALPFVGTFRKG